MDRSTRPLIAAAAAAAVLALATTACFFEIVEKSTETGDENGATGTGETGDPQVVCGDGVLEAAELCDGDKLDGQTCMDFGYTEGTLACAPDCSFDLSGCSPQTGCGNGVAEADEECDDQDFAGRTCESFGFVGGELACTPECTVDTSNCTEN